MKGTARKASSQLFSSTCPKKGRNVVNRMTPLNTCKRNRCGLAKHEKDYFDNLPDDIILCILSWLSPNQQAKMSVLSRRWRNLWRHSITGTRLIFDHDYVDTEFSFRIGDLGRVRPKFMKWVNFILGLFEEPTLDEFTIRFDLDKSCSLVLDGWLQFAIMKEVKRLELDLTAFPLGYQLLGYEFPRVEEPSISNLRELRLTFVNVSGEVMDYLLSSCPSLELLCLRALRAPNLTISGTSLALKYLEISKCYNGVPRVEVSAPNLISFKYDGPIEALFFRNIPLLSHLSMGDNYCEQILNRPSAHFGFVSQLKKLTLVMSKEIVLRSISSPLELPEFARLEELELTIHVEKGLFLRWPGALLNSAPLLQRLAVKLIYYGVSSSLAPERRNHVLRRNLVRKTAKGTHNCLKVVEVVGFLGCTSDLELVHHLLSVAKSLEKLVLDTRYQCKSKLVNSEQCHLEKYQKQAEKHAKQLAEGLPPNAQLVVL